MPEDEVLNEFEHGFDLGGITAENLRYYDEWPAERNKSREPLKE